MKLLLLLAFVGLAASASLRSRDFKANTPRELRYQYDAQIATGIEEVSNAFSTLRMRFNVVMRTDGAVDGETGAERWSLVFQAVNLRQRNNATDALPKTLLPMEQFKNIEKPDLWYQMERTLKKPFAVLIRPKELSISKVLFNEEDPFWSVNIKKGFLSLLQVNFIPKDVSSSTLEKGQWTKEIDEMTVAAKCKTFYSANKIEYHEADSQVFRVDKAIDFNNCLNPIDGTRSLPGIWNGLRHVRMLPGDKQKKSPIDVNNMAQYLIDMGGDRMTPTIRKASAKTVHILVPYSDSTHGSEKIFTVQKLRLLNSEASEGSPAFDTSSLQEQPEGIRLIYPEESQNIDREALKSKVIELFGQLFKSNSEIDMKVYESILRILRYHLKKEEDLNAIAEELKTAHGERHLKAFVLDICPQIGSHGAVKFLMKIVKMLVKITTPTEFVTRANLGVFHISVIFTKLSMMEKVQLKMLQTVFQVVKDETFRSKLMNIERMPIFSTAWLSMGAMVNVYYGKQGGIEPYMHPIKDNAEMVRKYLYAPWEVRQSHAAGAEAFRREFVRQVTEALEKTDFARNLALKVTKNSGLFELYQTLAPIIRKRDTTMVTERVQAVYATQNMLRRNTLVRVTAQDPRSIDNEQKFIRDDTEYRRHFERISSQIQADLITCFRNVREDPEVRIACYRVLMQCKNIKQTVLNMLVQSILSEPTQQVYTYCVQHMSQIAKSPLPRYTRVSQTVRSVLSMLKRRQPLDLVYSRVFHGQLWDELHKMGLTVETDMIVSDKSFTPRWTHIRIEHQGMGLNMPLLEIGLRTQGLQGLLEKVFGPRGMINKAGGVMKLLKRATRSLDSTTSDSELLHILPRILNEMPNMDLTVSLMGYDVVYMKNTRELVDSVKKMSGQAIKKSLASFGKFMKPFDGLFTISSSYELPTPAGTILDFNCLLNFFFTPRIVANKNFEDTNGKINVRISMPLTIESIKRIGSNMHVLNHYHQWLTTVKANRQVYYQFVAQLDKTNPNHIVFDFKLAAPSVKVPLVEFENHAFSTISESFFSSGSLSFTAQEKIIKHRKVAQQKTMNYSPIFSSILAPFGYKVKIEGSYFSARHLYQAPCSLFMGPSKYTIYMVPQIEGSLSDPRFAVISSKLEVIYPTEESKKMPQIKLQVNSAFINSDETETIRQKLVFASFTPRDVSPERITFDFNLRWFLNLPSSYRTNGYQLKSRCEIELPEDLKMQPRSLPLQPEEWYKERQLKMTVNIESDDGEVATIEITKSSNPELKKMLVDSELSEKDLKKAFPLLAACLNESRKSIKEEPLNANPLYTPSCVRQFKKFNKLSQTKVQITKKADWFMSRRESPLLDQAIQMINNYLKPYLVWSQVPKTAENKIVIVSCPSPVDMRVQHLNVTSPSRKNVWRSIQLPSVPFFWAGVDPVMTSAKDYIKGGASKCSLLHSHIRTFDNVIYSIPKNLFSSIAENQCPVLLAKDCSEKKEFQVLTHIKEGKKHITVHLNTDSSRPFVIEVSKSINSDEQKATVKVNGAELEHSIEPKKETEIMKRTINTEKGPVTIIISKYQFADNVMYKIKSVQHKIMVLVGGPKLRKVEIRVSPFYHNKVCGLCGDYNAEKFREFKAPNYHQVLASPQKMVEQYVLPISDSCKMNQETEALYNPENSLYLPSNIWYKSYDLPQRRPSCQITNNKKVKTFKHAEFKMVSPAMKQIIRETDCAIKLAVAKINDNKVRIFLKPSQSKVLIQVGSFKQQLTTTSPASNELSSDTLPAGLVANVNAKEELVKFEISKDENRVTVKITSDKRIIIKASQIDESEDAICELSHQSQIESESSQTFELIKKFTNAQESSVCRSQLKKKINQCKVDSTMVLPFYRASDYHRRQVRFLNNQLKNRLADSQTPIVLSVDQIGEDASIAHSVQLMYSRESDKLVRKVLLKKNRQTLVKVTMPEEGSAHRVTFSKDSAEQTISAPSSQIMDIDGNFQLTVSEDRVKVVHKANLYEVDVEMTGQEPNVKITRPYSHAAYKTTGLCQVNRLPEAQFYRSNPQAVLSSVMESCLRSLDSSAPILSEVEVGKISRLVRDFNDFLMA